MRANITGHRLLPYSVFYYYKIYILTACLRKHMVRGILTEFVFFLFHLDSLKFVQTVCPKQILYKRPQNPSNGFDKSSTIHLSRTRPRSNHVALYVTYTFARKLIKTALLSATIKIIHIRLIYVCYFLNTRVFSFDFMAYLLRSL